MGKGRAAVALAEQPGLHQTRHQLLKKQMHRLHRAARGGNETVNRTAVGPVDNLLQGVVHCAHHLPMRCRDHLGAQQQLLEGQGFTLDQAAQQAVVGAAAGIGRHRWQVGAGHRAAWGPVSQVEADHVLDRRQFARLVQPRVGLHKQGAGLFAGGGQVQAQARQQPNPGGVAAVAQGPLREIATQFQGGFLVGRRGEHQVCHRGGKVAPRCRCTCLDQRDARAGVGGQVERPLDLEVLAVMVDGMHLGRVSIVAAGAVDLQCRVGETGPQLLHHRRKFGGALIAFLGAGHLLQAEVFVALQGGHDIPAGAATAHPIQRLQLAGHHIRRKKGGRYRGHQTDMRRFPGHGSEQHGGVEAGKA